MTSKNTMSSGKDGTPTQKKLNFPTRTSENERTSSPNHTEGEREEFQTLIDKAVTWKLMSKSDNLSAILPTKLVQLATTAKETGRTRLNQNELLDRIILIAKILQEWSWKDKTEEWRHDLMQHLEEEINSKVEGITTKIGGIAREAQETWRKLEEATSKATDLSTKIATTNNTITERTIPADGEEGELTTNTTRTTYAHAARASHPPQPTHHPQHNLVIREAEMKDRRIIITSQTTSDWDLTEKELVAKANLAIARVAEEEGAEGTQITVLAATKTQSKGAFLLLRNADEVKWIKQDDRMERFGAAWGSTATMRPNYAEVVVETLPIETPIDSPIEQRRIETASASRDCPVFQGKLRERSKWDAERNYRLFVTKDPNTWGRMNEPVQEDFDQGWRANRTKQGTAKSTNQRAKPTNEPTNTRKIQVLIDLKTTDDAATNGSPTNAEPNGLPDADVHADADDDISERTTDNPIRSTTSTYHNHAPTHALPLPTTTYDITTTPDTGHGIHATNAREMERRANARQ
ncbi:hypothetical protein DFH05DRAFT_1615105, partial [Lentinula detonsa]